MKPGLLVQLTDLILAVAHQGLFQGGGGAGGAFAPPMKVFAPPQELVKIT